MTVFLLKCKETVNDLRFTKGLHYVNVILRTHFNEEPSTRVKSLRENNEISDQSKCAPAGFEFESLLVTWLHLGEFKTK